MRQIDLTYTIIVPTLARFFLNFIVDSATSNDTGIVELSRKNAICMIYFCFRFSGNEGYAGTIC